MDSVNPKYILRVLETENRWMTFDELYCNAQSGCDWTGFALQLEYLVKQGIVEYKLPCGMDVGYYRIK